MLLGYLTYDFFTREVPVPNYEVSEQFASITKVMDRSFVGDALRESDELLKAALSGGCEKVAELVDKAHSDNISILKYNNKNALSRVISLAYCSVKRTYTVERELPAGKGFADFVFRPMVNNDNPAMIIELKYDKSAEEALQQIKEKQ